MEFLIVWLITIILTKCIRTYHVLMLYKDIFSRGYKFSMNQELNPVDIAFEVNNRKIIPYVPFLNIVNVTLEIMGYNFKKDYIISVLKEYELLQEMTQEEKNKFAERPTSIGALLMAIDYTEQEERKKIDDGKNLLTRLEDDSEFIYQIDLIDEEIRILNVTGNAAKLNEDEQIEKLVEACKTKQKENLEEIKTFEEMYEHQLYKKLEKVFKKLSKEEQIELFNELKQEYIKSQECFYDRVLQKTKAKRIKWYHILFFFFIKI